MQERKSKKILIYFFLLLVVGSITNINLKGLKFQNINNINITGLDIKNKLIMLKKIENFNLNNIFLINKMDLKDEIESNTIVENYSILKRYPSTLDINIEKTKFLAKINKNGQIFYLGSNGKFIKNDFSNDKLPFVFGNPDVIEFFNIKEIIDKSKITFKEIKNLYFYPSKRWDLELKNNTIIKLPSDHTNLALNLAIEFLYDNKFNDNKIIDARINNQIILDD